MLEYNSVRRKVGLVWAERIVRARFFLCIHDPLNFIVSSIKYKSCGCVWQLAVNRPCVIQMPGLPAYLVQELNVFTVNWYDIRVQHRSQSILWAGQAAPKVDFARQHFHLPATLLNKGEIGLCPKHYLPSWASHGLVQLAPLPFFAAFTCNLQWASGYVACWIFVTYLSCVTI